MCHKSASRNSRRLSSRPVLLSSAIPSACPALWRAVSPCSCSAGSEMDLTSLTFPRKYNSDFSNCLSFYMKLKRLGFLFPFWAYFVVYTIPSYCCFKIANIWRTRSTKMNENMGKEMFSFLIVFLSEFKLALFVPIATIEEQWYWPKSMWQRWHSWKNRNGRVIARTGSSASSSGLTHLCLGLSW